VQRAMDDLVASGTFVYLQAEDGAPPACQPAGNIQGYSIGHILNALELTGTPAPLLPDSTARDAIANALDTMRSDLTDSPANKLLKDI